VELAAREREVLVPEVLVPEVLVRAEPAAAALAAPNAV
jgi:hypothetical protein